MSDPVADTGARDELLASLTDEFLRRHRAGERPTAEEYATQYPNLAQQIRELFPAMVAMEQGGLGVTLDPAAAADRASATIGRYKLLERIGEGGFGVVYMAEQQHPVRRKVALKVIKPGMDSRQVLARFEAERQALAIMDHPNIAKVLDAGATDAGRPYFVMELVKGEPITAFCDAQKFPPRQRLELFAQVCHAVQHAHQKGIIHRDVKPSNVLVSMHDTTPVVKVIDFGVAKALGQELTEMTLFTGFAQLVGTPLYMSPEQAGQSSVDVDTRSDIYSLGVLLYELLTGTTPFDRERFSRAAQDEIRRIIREEEPPKPSTRLSASKQSLASISAQRHTEPAKLTKLVRGELDWIVMKALEKDRSRRYETANGFAMDVQRYLNDEAVQACPPSTGYRFRKFARRNRRPLLGAAAMLAMLLALVAGLVISNVRVARERNQKAAALKEKEQALATAKENAARAEAERQRAESNFLKARTAIVSILAKAATGQAEWSQLSPALRKVFRDECALYYQSLIQEGGADPSLRYETAVGYRSLAGLHTSANELEKAEKYLLQSIQMLETLLSEPGKRVEYRHQLAYSNERLASILSATMRRAKARIAYERSAELYEGLLAEVPNDIQYPPELWNCYSSLLKIYAAERADRDLQRTRERAERVCREWVRLAPADPAAHKNLIGILREQKKLDDAIVVCRAAIERDPRRTQAFHNLGILLKDQGKPAEAVVALRRAVELDPKTYGSYHSLGDALIAQNKPDEAAAAYRKGLDIDPKNPRLFVQLGNALWHQQKHDEAAGAFRQAIALAPEGGSAYAYVGRPPGISPQIAAYQNLIRMRIVEKKLDEAITVCRELIQLSPKLTEPYFLLGNALWAQQKPKEAVAAFKEGLAIDPQFADGHNNLAWLLATCPDAKARDAGLAVALANKAVELDPKNADYVQTLGVAYYRTGDWKASIATLEKSIDLRKAGDSGDWFFLAMADWQLDNKEKARQSYNKAVAWMEKNAPKAEVLLHFRAEASGLLGIDEKTYRNPSTAPATTATSQASKS